MRVIERIDHGHGAGQGPFDRLAGLLAQEFGILDKNRLFARDGADHGRHAGIVAIADAHGLALFEIDARQVFDEGGDEMLAGLLAIADDIDACLALVIEREPQRIALAFPQILALQIPGRPELFGLRQPGGLGQAAAVEVGRSVFMGCDLVFRCRQEANCADHSSRTAL